MFRKNNAISNEKKGNNNEKNSNGHDMSGNNFSTMRNAFGIRTVWICNGALQFATISK